MQNKQTLLSNSLYIHVWKKLSLLEIIGWDHLVLAIVSGPNDKNDFKNVHYPKGLGSEEKNVAVAFFELRMFYLM